MDRHGAGAVLGQVAGEQAAEVLGAAGDEDDLVANAVFVGHRCAPSWGKAPILLIVNPG